MEKEKLSVNERLYRKMGNAGAVSISVGIITIVFGIAAGVMIVVNGAKILANRKTLLF